MRTPKKRRGERNEDEVSTTKTIQKLVGAAREKTAQGSSGEEKRDRRVRELASRERECGREARTD